MRKFPHSEIWSDPRKDLTFVPVCRQAAPANNVLSALQYWPCLIKQGELFNHNKAAM